MKPPAHLDNLPWRVAGLVLLGVLVVAYQTDQGDLINRLLIPLAMAFAAWLLVQNITAIALGGALLAGIHSDLGSRDWIQSMAYPALAVIGTAALAVIFTRRFRHRIAATHEARWRNRRRDGNQDDTR
jgi:cell division protein FtsW (lipid II flippase)